MACEACEACEASALKKTICLIVHKVLNSN